MQDGTNSTFDVAIIGYGPVGATLAARLGQAGHRVVVLDKSEQIYPLPRAFALDHEAMRTFQGIGIIPALQAHLSTYRPTLYLGADGEPIQHFDMGPPPYPLGWAPAYTFNQPALEAALREAVGALPTVQVRLGHEVTDTVASPQSVALTVRTPAGASDTLHARYAVACDGGTSPTRKRLGMTLKSLEFVEPWIVVDVHVNEDQLERLPATNIQYCNPARATTYVVGPGTHRRWEFLLLPQEAEQREMPHEAIWDLLSPWLKPDQARIWRAATYRFHAVVLQAWRQGPVLFAGDAAHQMPPFLAQGMCQGLRDAVNLSWKLDWVLRGRAQDALLDTYGQERGPQVEEVTATVKRLGQIICERDAALATARDARLRAEQGGQVRVQLRQKLLPGIRQGLLDGAAPPAGLPFPQPACQSPGGAPDVWMDDVLPRGFLLVLREPPTRADLSRWQPALQALDACVVSVGQAAVPTGVHRLLETQGVLAQWFADHACEAAVVRPDHVVYGVATQTTDVADLLARLVHQVPGAAGATPHSSFLS